MTAAELFLIAIAALLFGLVLLFGVGIAAVKRHPSNTDPARNARRYVVPAGVGFVIAVIATVSLLIIGAYTVTRVFA